MRRLLVAVAVGCMTLGIPTAAFAGQPGAPTNTCGLDNPVTPGGSASSPGSPFNSNGTAGTVYAGNPGTNSLLYANSVHAVSQYDVACVRLSH